MTSAIATTTSAAAVVTSTTSISLLRIDCPGLRISAFVRTASARRPYPHGHGQHARAQLELAPLGRFERDLEAHAVVDDDEIDDAALLESAVDVADEEHRALVRSGGEPPQRRRGITTDEQHVQAAERIGFADAAHLDRMLRDAPPGDDRLQLVGDVVGTEHADDDRRGRARQYAGGPFDVAQELVEECGLDAVLGLRRSIADFGRRRGPRCKHQKQVGDEAPDTDLRAVRAMRLACAANGRLGGESHDVHFAGLGRGLPLGKRGNRPPTAQYKTRRVTAGRQKKRAGRSSARPMLRVERRVGARVYAFEPRAALSWDPPWLPPMPAAPPDGFPDPLYIVPLPDDCRGPPGPDADACVPLVPDVECCDVPDCKCCPALVPDVPSIEPVVPLPYVVPLPVPERLPDWDEVASRISSVRPRCCGRGASSSISSTPSLNVALADSAFVPSGNGIVR